MALGTTDLTLGHFHLEDGREETLGRPAFSVGGLGNGFPLRPHGWQTQFNEHHRQRGAVGEWRIHAHASSPLSSTSKVVSEGKSTRTSGAAGTGGANSASKTASSGSIPASSNWANLLASTASHAPRIARSSRPTITPHAWRSGNAAESR